MRNIKLNIMLLYYIIVGSLDLVWVVGTVDVIATADNFDEQPSDSVSSGQMQNERKKFLLAMQFVFYEFIIRLCFPYLYKNLNQNKVHFYISSTTVDGTTGFGTPSIF